MYKNKGIDWGTQLLDFCLLVYETDGKPLKEAFPLVE
jgi:hypothetical protein